MSTSARAQTIELGIVLTTAIFALLEISLLVSFGLLGARSSASLALGWSSAPVIAAVVGALLSGGAWWLHRRRWISSGLLLLAALAVVATLRLLATEGWSYAADGRSSALAALLLLGGSLSLIAGWLVVRSIPGARVFLGFSAVVAALHALVVGGA